MDSKCLSSNITPLGLCMAIMSMVYGLLFAGFGYCCINAVGCITGVLFGAGMLYIIKPIDFNNVVDVLLIIIVAIVSATVGSKLEVAFGQLNAFGGAVTAYLLVSLSKALFGINVSPIFVYVMIAFGAILFLSVTFFYVKQITIISTSIIGSCMLLLLSFDYLLHDLSTLKWLEKIDQQTPPCYGSILLCLMPILILGSVWFQNNYTANETNPNQMRKSCRGSQCVLRPQNVSIRNILCKAGNKDSNNKKFRYLYQVRSNNGDKVCQPYIAALQKRIERCGSRKRCLTKRTNENKFEGSKKKKREVCFADQVSDPRENDNNDNNDNCPPTNEIKCSSYDLKISKIDRLR